ncbi:hypothetical protein BDD12DRAFT_845380 [Trichophaea hybrida]|nr:hypothetical protein BDD12DRAFT_845380 [Trichophaea hybrida]
MAPSATVYLLLSISHLFCFRYHLFAALYLERPPYMCHCVSAIAYLLLYVYHFRELVGSPMGRNIYASVYSPPCICYCISGSTAIYAPLCIRNCVSGSTALY